MNSLILAPAVQAYLRSNLEENPSSFALKKSPFEGITSAELAQQLNGLQKAQKKHPTWFETEGIYYPPTLNLEQTSSEETATYKASLFSGKTMIDLTGGYGVDLLAFSQSFESIVYCEHNEELAQTASHNFSKLTAMQIEVKARDSIHYLEETSKHFDLIYADPSRRHAAKGKVFRLEDCEPNIPQHLDLLFSKTKKILIKTSPLLDIQAAARELKYVSEVQAVAVNNEVKELLFVLEKDTPSDSFKKTGVNLNSSYSEPVVIDADAENTASPVYAEPQAYLYEPNGALLKLGVFNWISEHYNLEKLAPNSHLYTSEKWIDFPGRSFKIEACLAYSKKEISRLFKNQKVHVTTRNFKESVASLRSKFKLKDGGTVYLFFTTLENGKSCVIQCSKI